MQIRLIEGEVETLMRPIPITVKPKPQCVRDHGTGWAFRYIVTKNRSNVCDDTRITEDALARSLEAGLRAVARQTKARPGDKTMMDALTPAVAAATAAARAGKTIPEALEEAAHAARTGAESTRDLVARFGRARSLGERTRGYPDAGATSISLIFKGFKEGFSDGRS